MTLSIGSTWHRWDVHLHAPGTALAARYPQGSTDEFVERVNSAKPAPKVLGITDYLSIHCYREIRQRWQAGDLPGIDLIFPNIEFGLSPPTKNFKGVNFHLLVDPSDSEHETRIEEALARLFIHYGERRYSCAKSDITEFGRVVDPTQTDSQGAYRHGVNQFKVDFTPFRDWYKAEGWLRENSIVAASNSASDGISGLPKDHGYGATIEEMFRLAHIVFSGNPQDREFMLGRGTDSPRELARKFGGLKACLHGSDAHHLDQVLAPDQDRRCWIKAEPTFEGLRQVLYEPDERVTVGPEAPSRPRDTSIRSIQVEADWFISEPVPLNPGLVSIIGPRGSGKTALADLIALGADAFEDGPASFLTKAQPEATGTLVTVHWADEDEPSIRWVGEDPQDLPRVRYLSQHFVEQLCSDDGANDKLIAEIESVIFDSLDETDCEGASSFSELREIATERSQLRITELQSRITDCSDAVAKEHTLRTELPEKRKRQVILTTDISKIRRSLSALVVKGKEEKGEALQKLQADAAELEEKIAALKAKLRRLDELKLDFDLMVRTNADDFGRLKAELLALGVSETDLDAFRLNLAGNYKQVIEQRRAALLNEITLLTDGTDPPEKQSRHLTELRRQVHELQKEIGGDTAKEKRLVALQKSLKEKQQEQARLTAEIRHGEGAEERISTVQSTRVAFYTQVFEEYARQRNSLAGLYAPLASTLSEGPEERKKLEFFVRQLVDVEGWANRGESLLDLRKKSDFRDRGSLAAKAREILAEPWRTGDTEGIRSGISTLVGTLSDAHKYLHSDVTLGEFANWLFSTDHIHITYGIRYEGPDIERLSPGTRGIVLLILYLALDTADERPLIIDQPEENLDPQSIYEVLTGYFRESRIRRQVILVTHNANLVVNTDSDQVIVAASVRRSGTGLPFISYLSGGLEDPTIRTHVCSILEGGEEALLKRARRYGLLA